jgi:site-specific recombinase XerD
MFCYSAGLRVSEACGLRVDDINPRSMLLHLRDTKRGRERYVML